MSSIGLTHQQTDDLTTFAGFWTRALAKLVDWLILSICLLTSYLAQCLFIAGEGLVRQPA
jgi:hypothetical protein